MTTVPSNNRASLLSGLRTGGVRSTSAVFPHTAAVNGSFDIDTRRYVSQQQPHSHFPEEYENDAVEEVPSNQNTFGRFSIQGRNAPMTAAIDGSNNRFAQHQQQASLGAGGASRGMNPNSAPFNPGAYAQNQQQQAQQAQALQMQMMQLEILRLQSIQAQQYQAELIAQSQRQRQQGNSFNPPATAGPMNSSFDIRSTALNAQMRRTNQANQSGLGNGYNNESQQQVPMTASLNGKFGQRAVSAGAAPLLSTRHLTVETGNGGPDSSIPPVTPGGTTVISGGTSLGHPSSNNISAATTPVSAVPSKSDSATTWRRGPASTTNHSVLRSVTSPAVKVTPPTDNQRVSPPPVSAKSPPPTSNGAAKFRPQPLQFNAAVSKPLSGTIAVDSDAAEPEFEVDGDGALSSASSKSSPTTPPTSGSSSSLAINDLPPIPLSPRQEASQKLYEGLGVTRRSSPPQPQAAPSQLTYRAVSQPLRQPRGPPSGMDELAPKNFATRIRRKAIGGLGALMGARERREVLEAY